VIDRYALRAIILAGGLVSVCIEAQTPAAPPVAVVTPAATTTTTTTTTTTAPPPVPAAAAVVAMPPISTAMGEFARLIALPKMTEQQARELITDLALQLEVVQGYRRAPPESFKDYAAAPDRIVVVDGVWKRTGADVQVLRFGYLIAPRRLPQLWVFGATRSTGGLTANPDMKTESLDPILQALMSERNKLMSKVSLSDLESRILNLSYLDADGALFALRAMGYSAITNDDAMPKDDSYRGEDVTLLTGTTPAVAPPPAPDPAAAAAPAPVPGAPDKPLPKFPSLKNLPSSISVDRLPLIVRMPSPDPKMVGLVGGDAAVTARDQLGLTVIPQAASNLSDTMSATTSQLLVLYHPGYPEQLAKVRRILQDTIDKPARQIFVEGLVMEVSSDALRDLGVKWDFSKGDQRFVIGALGTLPVGGVEAGDTAFTALRNSLTNISPTQFKAQLNALVQTNKAEVLSRPSVLTLDNRQATIRVGTDIPVSTSKDASSAGSGSSRVAFSFQYIPTGILLNVRPRLSEDGSEISMLIDATVSAAVPGQDLRVLDPATRVALASAPTISTRRVQTYARIRDNQPLIIGGLVSRNQVSGADKVPGVGEIPWLGKLFGHESKGDSKREVIIVLTPSVITENIRETKAQYPKDDDIFDLRDTALFKEHYRIRAEDLVDSSFIRFNRRYLTYRDIANRVIERNPDFGNRAPFSQFTGGKIPGEFIFVSGMMYKMLERMDAGAPIKAENLQLFEKVGNDQRPLPLTQLLARFGDGREPMSFFERNKGRALALTFRQGRNSMQAGDLFAEPSPEIRLLDCPDRNAWRQMLWDLNQPSDGVPRYTILIQEPQDLKRVQLAYATQNTVLNNGGVAGMVFDRWLPGRMMHLQEVSPTWERILLAPIAQYFFIGEHYMMYFMREHEAAIQSLDRVLRRPDMAAATEGITLP
jgi:Flp pilus assembly secretin CpaC